MAAFRGQALSMALYWQYEERFRLQLIKMIRNLEKSLSINEAKKYRCDTSFTSFHHQGGVMTRHGAISPICISKAWNHRSEDENKMISSLVRQHWLIFRMEWAWSLWREKTRLCIICHDDTRKWEMKHIQLKFYAISEIELNDAGYQAVMLTVA